MSMTRSSRGAEQQVNRFPAIGNQAAGIIFHPDTGKVTPLRRLAASGRVNELCQTSCGESLRCRY